MALRKPLVIVNGRIRQIAANDTVDAQVSEVDIVNQQNNNVASIVIGSPVYNDGAGTVDLAQADAAATVEVLGLVKDATIAAAASGAIQTDGIMVATTAQWDACTGDVGGLTPGSVYFLDPDDAGKITKTAPTAVGDFVVRLGKAISTTEMEITILQPIEL